MPSERQPNTAFSLLKQALSQLAAPGPVALSMLPNIVPPDELALEFDDALHIAKCVRPDLATKCLPALSAVDTLLNDMSGSANAELWTEEAVISHPRWQEVREAARIALAAIIAANENRDSGESPPPGSPSDR